MAKGHDNLIPFNKCTEKMQREIRSKGGKAKAEKCRQNKAMREVFQQIKNLPVQDAKLSQQLKAVGVVDEDITYAAAMAWSTIYHAMKGNSQMMRLAMEMLGENNPQDIKVTIQENPYTKLSDEDLRKLADSDGQ